MKRNIKYTKIKKVQTKENSKMHDNQSIKSRQSFAIYNREKKTTFI